MVNTRPILERVCQTIIICLKVGPTLTFVNVNQSACETVMEGKVVAYKFFFSRVYICQALSSLFSGFPGRNALFLTRVLGMEQPSLDAVKSMQKNLNALQSIISKKNQEKP